MPVFAKCFNQECYCYGQYQLAKQGSCEDCGAPLHQVEGQGRTRPRPPNQRQMVESILSGTHISEQEREESRP